MNLIFIYGPPGVGKLTVGKELARLTGYKLFHNHVTIDWARTILDSNTEAFWRLVERLRFAVLEEAARGGVSMIFTFAYVHPSDTASIDNVREFVERARGRLCFVHLFCDTNVLEERVQSPERAQTGKTASIEGLRREMGEHDYLTPIPGHDNLRIDNTELEPAAVARQIVTHFQLPLA